VRVLHVVDSAEPRGGEIFASDLIRAIDRPDVSHRVAILRDLGGVTISYGAPTVVLPASGRTVPGFRMDPATIRGLRSIVRRWTPDIVQSHGGDTLKHAVAATTGYRIRLVYRAIGAAPSWATRGPRRVVYGRLIRSATRVVAVAEAVRHEIVARFGASEAHVVTIANGVDPERLSSERSRASVRRSLGIPSGSPVILSLGSLNWEKDPLAHLQVVSRVCQRVPAVRHLMVGDGPLRDEVSSTVGRMGLAGRVLVLGARRDIADLLRASDVVLLASRIEGMPACLIEGGMAGLPAVAYAIAGIPEIVDDGSTGVLVRPGDVGGLADSVSRLLADPETRKAMGRRARLRCRAHFDVRVIATKYLELWQEILTSTDSSRAGAAR